MTKNKPNRLIGEKSPYLLQHAYNPVDWYPWGEEAFAKALENNSPIFLSIGYATCYWCHVMERECFEDFEVARLLNENFISIKVDREENPYIDKMYMDFAAALMSSSTGWPLNVFLTPDRKPFFACTYLPAEPKEGLMGLKQLIEHVYAVWNSDQRDQLFEQADQVIELLQTISDPKGNKIPSENDIEKIMGSIFESVDPIFGGFQGEPKFPLFSLLLLLLNFSKIKEENRSAFFVNLTLEKIALGGIYDRVGGGFCRYAIDMKWHVPHFEKMLYDNALLAEIYLYAFLSLKNKEFAEISEKTLDYIKSEMTDPDGGFLAAEDAESEGIEGAFYTFSMGDLKSTLDEKELSFCTGYYQISEAGNFHGRSILYTEEKIEQFASRHNISSEEAKEVLNRVHEKLLTLRSKRPRPLKDDKVITSWTALMTHTMAIGAKILSRDDFAEMAIKSMGFILKHLYKQSTILRRYKDGEAAHRGVLDDYVCVLRALITLFELDYGLQYLEKAIELTEIIEKKFKSESGSYYYCEEDDTIFFRKCDFYDGSEPSGNSFHLENLQRLYQITKEKKYLKRAEEILSAISEKLSFFTPSNTHLMKELLRYYDKKALSIIIALDEEEEGKEEIMKELLQHYLPNATLTWMRVGERYPYSTFGREPIDGKTTLYLCYRNRCLDPVIGTKAILEKLSSIV